MNKIVTKIGILVLSLFVFNMGYAQLGVTGSVSGLKFTGSVGRKSNANFFSDARVGYDMGFDLSLIHI